MPETIPNRARNKKISITVSGGVAYSFEETVPDGYEIEIIDYDEIREGFDRRSEEAKLFCITQDLD
jgi:hypothetical protein